MAISKKAITIVSLTGLAALLLAAKPDLPRKVFTSLETSLSRTMDNAVYNSKVEDGTKYVLQPYTIRPGDTLHMLAGGNQMTSDYIKDLNKIKNVGKIQPGEEILVPARVAQDSRYGKTISELYREL